MKYILLLFMIIFYLQSCEFGLGCSKEWTFEVPFTLENEQAIYTVNDTIWISSYLDQKLTDAITGEKIEYPDFGKHQMAFTLVEFDGIDAVYAQEKMELFPVQGEYRFVTYSDNIIKGNSGLFTISFENNPPNYEAKFGIILQETGTFNFQVFSLAWTINDNQVEISECRDYLAGFEVKFSNESDFNFDIYEQWAKPDIYTSDKNEYVNSGIFTFQVVE